MHRAMISNISDVIGILGADGKIKYKSPNITKHFGWSPEELVGKDSLITIHPDDKERIGYELSEIISNPNNLKEVQYRYLCKDGTYKIVQLYARNLIEDNNINGILINYRDIAGKVKQGEEKKLLKLI